jgi:hypothetical protein
MIITLTYKLTAAAKETVFCLVAENRIPETEGAQRVAAAPFLRHRETCWYFMPSEGQFPRRDRVLRYRRTLVFSRAAAFAGLQSPGHLPGLCFSPRLPAAILRQ